MTGQTNNRYFGKTKKIILILLFTSFFLNFGHALKKEDQTTNRKNNKVHSENPFYRLTDYDADPYDWPVSSPEEEGINSRILSNAYGYAE